MNFKQTGRRRGSRWAFATEKVLTSACLFFLLILLCPVLFHNRYGGKPLGRSGEIMITAHRGASHGAPENTKASIRLAIAEQADYAEIDVRLTADKIPVLLHDRALFRTTGVVNDIDKVTYAEAVTYDAGGRYGENYGGETIPGLKEILEEYGQKIRFNIELKGGDDRMLAEAVVRLIEAYGLEERCVVTSDSYEQLKTVKRINEKIKTGYIISLVYGEIYGYDAADFFSIKAEYITEQMVRGLHERGKEIHAWTVNKAYEIERMEKLGVDNIITDMPAYARELLP